MNVWKMEPALISGLVAAVVMLLISFGVPLTDDQQKAILAFTAAALMLVQGFVTRQNVYSPESVRKLTGRLDPAVPSPSGTTS